MTKLLSFTDNKVVYSWALYDWANSAYATTVIAAVLPTYFSKVAAAGLAPNIASSYWAYATTFAMVLLVFLSPVLLPYSTSSAGQAGPVRMSSMIRSYPIYPMRMKSIRYRLLAMRSDIWVVLCYLP